MTTPYAGHIVSKESVRQAAEDWAEARVNAVRSYSPGTVGECIRARLKFDRLLDNYESIRRTA